MTTCFTRPDLIEIPIVAYGVFRDVAASMDPLFKSTPFRMAAILDHATEPAAFRYTHHNLGVVLYSLNPRPKVFITGAAISEDMTKQSIRVWDFYVRETKAEDTLVINLCDELPPDGDWMGHIIRSWKRSIHGKSQNIG